MPANDGVFAEYEAFGVEDLRICPVEDSYLLTYSAYSRHGVRIALARTRDFEKVERIALITQTDLRNVVVFPEMLGGRYVMLSCQDGENNQIMFSDNIHFWQTSHILQEPEYLWEFTQIGNCGSPLETDKGWIVLTHGVGPMRQYCIGAMLPDLENPAKVIARLDEPLLAPRYSEREGYVPNVVYSCGAIIHNDELVIPYAMSDINSGIATLGVAALLGSMCAVA